MKKNGKGKGKGKGIKGVVRRTGLDEDMHDEVDDFFAGKDKVDFERQPG
jgi:hypothetical protein